jgi:hypothetical protein
MATSTLGIESVINALAKAIDESKVIRHANVRRGGNTIFVRHTSTLFNRSRVRHRGGG